ncbi:MAG: hypothetical protein IPL40_10565 [Proteobacteria bacterium]|nr:hypothetical protein [Pseudomonadota bacterium]
MRHWFWAVLLLLGAAVHPRAAWAELRHELESGQVVAITIPADRAHRARAVGIVDAAAARVFAVLTDVPNYVHFAPRIAEARRLKDAKKGLYELVARLPWPLGKTRARLQLQHGKRGAVYVARWKMVEGTLARYEGAFWVKPWGRNRCLVIYEMLLQPRLPVPEALLSNGLRRAVQKFVLALRQRIVALDHG